MTTIRYANVWNCQTIKALLKSELMTLERISEQVRKRKSHIQSNEQMLFSIQILTLSWRASAVQSVFIDKQHQTPSLGGYLASLCSTKTILWKVLDVLCACPQAPPQHLTVFIWILIVDSPLQAVLCKIKPWYLNPKWAGWGNLQTKFFCFLVSFISYKSSTLGSYKFILGQWGSSRFLLFLY